MATATSLTAAAIEEKMAGWVQVGVVQEQQAALLSTFQAILDTNTANLQNFEDVVLPGISADLADSAISIANLTDNLLPAQQVQIDGNTEDLQQLNDVVIPDLQAGLNSNYEWINELNTVTLPAWQTQMDANNAAVNELNTVTLPAMQTQLDANTADIAAIDISGLQTQLDANTADISTLNTNLGTLNTNLGAANAEIDAVQAKFPITAPDIAANAVEANAIAAGAVVAGKIAADAVTANEIAANAVTANELAADAVTANKIAAGAVVAGKIAADAVTANEIAANAVTATEIAADAVTATKIAAGAVVAGKIAADAVTANEIAANAVTATEIAAGAVVAGKIAADAVTANEIAANAVTATEIAADAVTANKIQAGAVVAGKIGADAVTATEIAANAVTATELAANAVTAAKIAAGAVTTTKLMVGDLTNLVSDGQLAETTNANWVEPHTRIAGTSTALPYFEDNVSQALQFTHYHNRQNFAAVEGDKFYIQFDIATPATNTEEIVPYLGVLQFDANHVGAWWAVQKLDPIAPNTPWTTYKGVATIFGASVVSAEFDSYFAPSDTTTGAVQKVQVRNFVCRRQQRGELIVDGSIEALKIKTNTITADQIDTSTLTGDLFVGEVIFGGLMRAGDLDDNGIIIGGYSEMGARGIFTVDDTGAPVFTAPTSSADGAYLKAHLDLLSADVRDNFTMHGTNNSIATEGELTLSAGVEAPSVPPVLQQVWDQVQFNKTTAVPPHTPNPGYNLGTFAFNPSQVTSIAWDSTWSNWTVIQQKSNGFRVWRFNSDGTIQNNLASGRPWVDDWNDRLNAHCTYNDDKNGLATIFLQGDQWFIWDPQYINKIPSSWIIDAASRPPALYYDTINNQYCLVQNNGGGSGTIHVRRFTVNSGANFPNATSVSTQNFEAESGLSQRINGVVYGSQLGVTGWAIAVNEYQTVYTFNGSGVQFNDDGSYRNWLKPGPALGFTHNGTNFVSIDSAGVLTAYSNWTWLQSDAAVWIGASAADTDAGGTGLHETPVGTMKSINLYRRSKLKITMPETNDSGGLDDPDKWRLYFKRGGTVAPTDKTLLKLIGDIGSPTVATSITISADASGGAPPGGIKGQPDALNNFPGADPGRLESAAVDGISAIISLLGDGSGRTGPLSWNTSGAVTNTPLPVGTVIEYGGDVAPTNFMLCQGQTLSRAAYPELYAVIGTKFGYGSNDGLTFSLPNMINRYPFGAGGLRTVGGHETGGGTGTAPPGAGDQARFDHRHSHTVDSHDHGTGAIVQTKATNTTTGGGATRVTDISGNTGTRAPGTDSQGVGNPGNLAYHAMLAFNYIIKVKS